MLKKIKDILGIEGVKIELILEPSYKISDGCITGKISLSSQSDQFVENVSISLFEKYQRGRGENALINEYLLGSLQLQLDLPLSKNSNKQYDFTLAYQEMKSDMDRYHDKQVFSRPLIWLAKKLKNVKSTYRIEASAKIKGTKLNPIYQSKLDLK